MRIVEISVAKLFGIFNHTIPLRLDDRITIIHGPNGFGKTILLKMLDGLFNAQYSELRTVPFREFRIKFDDGSVLWVEKTEAEQPLLLDEEDDLDTSFHEESRRYLRIIVNFSVPNETLRSFSLEPLRRVDFPLAHIERAIPFLDQVAPRRWLFAPTGEVLGLEEVLDRFGDELPRASVGEPKPEWWAELQSSVSIRLIETQRLLSIREAEPYIRRRKLTTVPVVEEYSQELAATIKTKLAESGALSQSLDRTFPVRLVERMGKSRLSEDELRERLSELERKRSRLREVGLLDREEDVAFLPASEIVDNTKDVLEIYVQDVEQKLSVFDDIADKIGLFQQTIRDRFLYKEIVISKQRGFSFITPEGEPLPLAKLSSGEQHELVLLYELLFKVKPGSLILIDEPELSLHVAWQKQVLRDLREITKLVPLDVLIATHSPQIIADRWDLTERLDGPAAS